METKELFTKDSCLYKKNGRYKNLIKAYNLYVNSLITNNSMTIMISLLIELLSLIVILWLKQPVQIL